MSEEGTRSVPILPLILTVSPESEPKVTDPSAFKSLRYKLENLLVDVPKVALIPLAG